MVKFFGGASSSNYFGFGDDIQSLGGGGRSCALKRFPFWMKSFPRVFVPFSVVWTLWEPGSVRVAMATKP